MTDSHSMEDVRKHVRTYLGVFATLAVLTILTVAVSYFHLPIAAAVVVALAIAAFKGSLVASFFMHLINEKRPIYWILLLTLVFFVALMFLPLFAKLDQVHIHVP
jgi:cytochrome c oxidase subunit IV